MQKVAFFTQEQAYDLIRLLIEKGDIAFPRIDKVWASNDDRIERLDGIGESLLALLRQLTGEPGINPSEAADLMKVVRKIDANNTKIHDEEYARAMKAFGGDDDEEVTPSDRS